MISKIKPFLLFPTQTFLGPLSASFDSEIKAQQTDIPSHAIFWSNKRQRLPDLKFEMCCNTASLVYLFSILVVLFIAVNDPQIVNKLTLIDLCFSCKSATSITGQTPSQFLSSCSAVLVDGLLKTGHGPVSTHVFLYHFHNFAVR